MDRLKRGEVNGVEIWSAYLHSNMDRLKQGLSVLYDGQQRDLHSNMDRLKQDAKANAEEQEVKIYIPIWID